MDSTAPAAMSRAATQEIEPQRDRKQRGARRIALPQTIMQRAVRCDQQQQHPALVAPETGQTHEEQPRADDHRQPGDEEKHGSPLEIQHGEGRKEIGHDRQIDEPQHALVEQRGEGSRLA